MNNRMKTIMNRLAGALGRLPQALSGIRPAHASLSLAPLALCTALLALVMAACSGQYTYETVPGDPLEARIYTLDNGLKVYMTVNRDQPRIQTFIAVRVGGKNDPAETTGLAHYFEHLMFKGTTHFGTQDYEAEAPLLDQIEQQFEVYRQTTDPAARTAIYHTIDSLSYEASKLAIPNEYDKLMTAIGASGTNAYTGFDVTCYTEDIPSNQVENWARIQGERFQNCVIRGFHTELETVYEEKNMSLTRDARKVSEAMLAALFPHHPYGTQTVLGTQEHLKNPSITAIKNYFHQWYVPNNMAICLSGDFDPEQMIRTIDRYFGALEPNPNLPRLQFEPEQPITEPIVREVYGLDAENVALAWRLPAAADRDMEALTVLSQVLYNGQSGLIDLDIAQQQKALSAFAYPMSMADYSVMIMQGRPGPGQTLEQVQQLLLEELRKLREGEFDEALLEANINNFRADQLRQQERNSARADMFVDAFINGAEWADEVTALDRMAQLTKQDIVDAANKYLLDTNYAVIYKRQGPDPNEQKIAKPQITPIVMNRNAQSDYLLEVQASEVAPIEPVFLDYSTDLAVLQGPGDVEVIYKKNERNELFELNIIVDMGDRHDPLLSLALDYLDYLGTSDLTAEQLKAEFYRMACDYSFRVGTERTTLSLRGLSEYLPEALALLEHLLADAQANPDVLTKLVGDEIKARHDAKLNQSQCFSRLQAYVTWGPVNPYTWQPTEARLRALRPQELLDRIHGLTTHLHRLTYYGPQEQADVLALLAQEHPVPAEWTAVPEGKTLQQQLTPETRVYLAPYQAKQIYMAQVSDRGEKYDLSIEPARRLYNEYFGGGMNGIVFQEMRESRGLAYSARASLAKPSLLPYDYSFSTYIATQNDKMMDAIEAFNEIINRMPESEPAFQLAKDGLTSRLRTQRSVGSAVINRYLSARDFGETDEDINRPFYNYLQTATLQDVTAFQQQWIKDRAYSYAILGDAHDLDLAALRQLGPVVQLSLKDIFGY